MYTFKIVIESNIKIIIKLIISRKSLKVSVIYDYLQYKWIDKCSQV